MWVGKGTNDPEEVDEAVFCVPLFAALAAGASDGEGRRAGTSAMTRSGGPGKCAGPVVRIRARAPTRKTAPP